MSRSVCIRREVGRLLGVGLLLVAGALCAEPTVNSLQLLVQGAVDTDPRVGQFVAELQEARANVTEAMGAGDPKLYLKGELGRVHARDEAARLQEEHVVGLEWRQRLWDWGGLEAKLAMAQAAEEASIHRLYRIKNEVALEWVEAWLQWVYASRILQTYEAFHLNMQRQLMSVQEKNRAGIGRITDVRLVRARLFQAKARQQEAKLVKIRARQQLDKLSGERVAELWLEQWPAVEQWPLPEEVEERQLLIALSRYQESLAELNIARFQRNEIRSEQGGTLDLQADVERGRLAAGSEDQERIQLLFRAPLYQGRVLRSRELAAERRIEQAQKQLEEVERALGLSWREGWASWHGSRRVVEWMELSVEAEQQATNGIREEVQAGIRPLLDGLKATEELLQRQISLTEARFELYRAHFSLLAMAGTLISAEK